MGNMHRLGRAALRVCAGLLALLALAIAGGWFWLRGSLPPLAGELTLPGLSAPVRIVRDAAAVPHIRAASIPDAWFALGFVHAQDRLWQMDVSRRIAAGRMAEAFGVGALDTDRLLRALGLARVAENNYRKLDAGSRAVLDAYAAGVNAWLATRSGPLPPEFLLTGLVPEPWRPADSLAWLKVMSLDLGSNWSGELARLRLTQRLPTARIQEFMPPVPYEGEEIDQDRALRRQHVAGEARIGDLSHDLGHHKHSRLTTEWSRTRRTNRPISTGTPPPWPRRRRARPDRV